MICLAILEIPTGGLADMFGHKASVIAGLLFQSISFLFFFLFPTFPGFMVGMLFSAIGLSIQSGALSSLVYELLQKDALQSDFPKVYGKASGYFLIASVVASPIGSFIYSFHKGAPYILAFLVLIAGGITIQSIKWEFTKKTPTIPTYFKTIGGGINMALRNRILLATVIIGIGLSVQRLVFNQNINQPYIVSVGVDVKLLGFVAALISLVQAFVSINAHKITEILGPSKALILMILVPSITAITLSFVNSLLAIPIILIMLMGHAFRDPVMAYITQEQVKQDKRATMASTISFLVSISVGLVLPYFGKGIDIFGIQKSFILIGIFPLILGSIGIFIYRFNIKRVTG